MIKVLATNIISPLGETTEQNYQAVKSGSSALSVYDGWRNIPQVFTASLLSDEQSKRLLIDGYTHLLESPFLDIRNLQMIAVYKT